MAGELEKRDDRGASVEPKKDKKEEKKVNDKSNKPLIIIRLPLFIITLTLIILFRLSSRTQLPRAASPPPFCRAF